MKNFIWIALVGALCVVATPASAQLYIGLGIRVGPPPPRKEVIAPRPHRNWVWVPGFYEWKPKHRRYVWIHGRWERPPRAHAAWVAPRWEKRNNEWVYTKGSWQGGDTRRSGDTRRR